MTDPRRVRLGRPRVLPDDAVEAVDAHDLSGGRDRSGIRRPELKCAMRAGMVVVVEELGKDTHEMALPGDDQKI